MADILFYIFAFIIIVSAAGAVFLPNILYAGICLFGSFFGVAVFYLLLGADFVAATQGLIYVGGILALLLFAVMLSKNICGVKFEEEKRRKYIPALISVIILGFLLKVILTVDWNLIVSDEPAQATTGKIGTLLLTEYLLPFELASLLLLAALIGAILLARSK